MTRPLDQALEAVGNLPPADRDDITRVVLRLARTDDGASAAALAPEERAAVAASKPPPRVANLRPMTRRGPCGPKRVVKLRWTSPALADVNPILHCIAAHSLQSARRVQFYIRPSSTFWCCIPASAPARARAERGLERGQKMDRPPKLTPHRQRKAIKRRDRGEELLADVGRNYNVGVATISERRSVKDREQEWHPNLRKNALDRGWTVSRLTASACVLRSSHSTSGSRTHDLAVPKEGLTVRGI